MNKLNNTSNCVMKMQLALLLHLKTFFSKKVFKLCIFLGKKHIQNKPTLTKLKHVFSCSFQYQALIIIIIWLSMHFEFFNFNKIKGIQT
jgi:hypothetical protein